MLTGWTVSTMLVHLRAYAESWILSLGPLVCARRAFRFELLPPTVSSHSRLRNYRTQFVQP